MLKVKLLNEGAKLPEKAKDGDAGYDLFAIDNGVFEENGLYIEYNTGIAIELPLGYHTEIFPRSSISKQDLVLSNSIGLVDNGYRGTIKLRFKLVDRFVLGKMAVSDDLSLYSKGDRIGQLVIRKTEHLPIEEVKELSETERGSGGFGSSGK